MKRLKVEDVLLIHERVIEATGGTKGVINWEALESALNRPFATAEGREVFPTLWDKVAAFIHAIVAFHPFADGNKRVALVAADVWLRMNGYRIPPGEEVEEVFWRIARGEMDVEQISRWLREWCRPYP